MSMYQCIYECVLKLFSLTKREVINFFRLPLPKRPSISRFKKKITHSYTHMYENKNVTTTSTKTFSKKSLCLYVYVYLTQDILQLKF